MYIINNIIQSIVCTDNFCHQMEDITQQCEDMNFILNWLKQYFTNECSE